MGAEVANADEMVHRLLREPAVKQAVVNAFGVDVLGMTGQVERTAVADIAFGDERKLRQLNRLLHPAVREAVCCKARVPSDAVLVIDAPLLFEGGLADLCDRIVFVDAPAQVCRRRLRRTRGWDPGEADRRQRFQRDAQWKMARSDSVIDNTGSERDLIEKARRFWRDATCARNRDNRTLPPVAATKQEADRQNGRRA